MYNEKLKFRNGKFRIMQIADVQEEATVSSDTRKLLRLAIEREKPDLIVFTGDQIYGVSPYYRLGSTEKKVRAVIDAITADAEKNGIPFAVTFGNHDRQCGIPNGGQAKLYGEKNRFAGAAFLDGENRGVLRLPVHGEKGHIFDLFLIDSNGQSPTGEYMPVLEEQLERFREEREKAKEDGCYTPCVVFQHIPVPEYFDVLRRCRRQEKGAVEAFRTHRNEWYVLPDDIIKKGGFMYESPAIPDRNSGEFDALKEKGNVLALIVGHDHNNSFVGQKDGIRLIYTQCAGFNVYGPSRKRGVRMIELTENDPTDFGTYTVTFDELTADRLADPFKEFILTHIPTSMEQVKRLALLAGAAGLAAAGAGLALRRKQKKL